jgi:adenylate kinase family enzyme
LTIWLIPDLNLKMNSLPQVIILYGPPAGGKGTQALKLKELLPDYYHLDFGTELRKFVADNLGDYNDQNEIVAHNAVPESVEVARRLKEEMSRGPARTEDLRYVVEKAITDNIDAGKGMIIEGPGRLIEEAKWLSGFFAHNNVSVVIFHLHLDLDEAIKRAVSRYYIPSQKMPFNSYAEAQRNCKPGEEPFQRKDDTDAHSIKSRFKTLYSDHYAEIISIYQLQAKALVLTLNADKPMDQVSGDINLYLEKFFGF